MPTDLALIRRLLAAHAPRMLAEDGLLRRAAVATVLREGPSDLEVLLIQRSERPEDPWSGHMAFPGGRKEPDDPDLLATVRREAMEEVGLDLTARAELLGRLDDIEAIARGRRVGMAITPFVFAVSGPVDLRPNVEVKEALWAPLGPLVTGTAATVRPYQHEGRSYEFPAFDVGGKIVWGLTYQMLLALFTLLR